MAKTRGYSSVIFLVFALAVVITLMWQIRKNIDLVPSEKSVLPEGIRVGVVDSTYWNYIQYFSVTRPGQNWEMHSLGEIDTLVPEDTTKPELENVIPLLTMSQSRTQGFVGTIDIGVVNVVKKWSPKRFAIQVLGETIQKYESTGDRVRLLTPTSYPTHSSGQGAYFVVVLPPSSGEELPVWIFTAILRRNWAFTILCRTSEAEYPKLRLDFERVVKNFKFLLMSPL